MSTTTTTACSTLFVDLATFSELEGFLYGGPHAVTYFVASVQKANWFSFIPITLRHCSGTPDFGQRNVAASVNRSGDYVLSVWFRAQIPPIGLTPNDAGTTPNTDSTIQWTRNLMHNLFEHVSITFNELTVQEYSNYWLDNNYQFRLRDSKRIGYRNMIGDVSTMTTPVGPGVALGDGSYRSCPLTFWFAEDSGLALPVAALPFNDIKINYTFRRWQELVMINPGTVGGAAATVADVFIYTIGSDGAATVTTQEPRLIDPQTYAHYVVVHNDERVKMGDAPRDMLIRQIQEAQISPFKDVTSRTGFDLRLSHAIVSFFFAAENISLYEITKGNNGREMSNYTTCSAMVDTVVGSDPFSFSQLLYENTPRLAMGSDYYSLIHPYYFSDAIAEETGYHMWAYALKPWSATCPSGSTNYSKLANVSLLHDMSNAAIDASGVSGAPFAVIAAGTVDLLWPPQDTVGAEFPQKWRHVFVSSNWNIARVANGSLGHPTL